MLSGYSEFQWNLLNFTHLKYLLGFEIKSNIPNNLNELFGVFHLKGTQ